MSPITKKEFDTIVADVKRNEAVLAACSGHAFFRLEPDKLFSKYRCAVCGGTVDMTALRWYERGLAHGRKLP